MINRFLDILSDKITFWHSNHDKRKLTELLLIWVTAEIITVIFFAFELINNSDQTSIISFVLFLVLSALGIICIINGRTKCALNLIFTLPLVLYAFYFSDFSNQLAEGSTIYSTIGWLIAGLLILLIYSESAVKVRLFIAVGLATVVFQLAKSGNIFDSFADYKPIISHPLVAFTTISVVLYIVRIYFSSIILKQKSEIQALNQAAVKVVQDSSFSIAQLRAERDEAGNIVSLIVEKVNNTFEATFKINLYEVQEQKADYIFNLIFKGKFDLNRYIHHHQKSKKVSEFHASGIEKWFNIHVIQPDYFRFYIALEDITKIKVKIADLEESKRRYKVLLEAIPDMFFIIDKDGTYEDFVVKESSLFKVEDANIIGSTIYEVGFPENMADKIYSCIQDSLHSNSIETIEYSMNTPNGTFMFEMRLAKLTSNSVISISRDITKRKTAEFKLEKALVKAEESDRLKSAFLANLSHEIKTPMNLITNLTRMLAETDVRGNEKLEIVDSITANGKQLLNMIDNTIHLSKIETQNIDISNRFVNINHLLRDIYNKYFILVPDSKNVRLALKLSVPNKEFGFETDSNILGEILSLLVDNAIKYTVKGEITIDYEMIRNEQVKFIISDTGIGIPPEEHKNIFRRFYRVANAINSTTSGSGLGLPIVQHYVMLLGGELEFESVPGKGSKFWFSLPFQKGKGFLSVVY